MIQEYEIKYISLDNGERLAFREVGKGENVLLLIHGNMSSGLHYLPILERLPEDFKAYTLDLRGFGESSYNHRFDSLKELSEDVYNFTTKLGLKGFTMVGWSTGGAISMQFVADHPGLAKKLVLIDSASYMGYPVYKKDENGKMKLGEVYKSKEEMAMDPVQVAPAAASMQNKDFNFMNWIWDLTIYTNKKPEAEYNYLYINETLKQRNLIDLDWALSCFNMSGVHNGYTQGSGLIDKIDIPVLSFWGNKDKVVLEQMVTLTVEAIGDNAKYMMLEDCGHSPLIDCPDKLMAEIIHFIKE